ncbi:MAG TPA: hypothetical protein VLI04_03750 [Nocardioidaceae bacterium]|nr:hypothetical protein [Nocardioidaceae bacterium]
MTAAAHSIHYLIVYGGLVGVAFLLVPQLAFRGEARAPRTPFEQRIADLRYTVDQGLLGTGATLTRPRVQHRRSYSPLVLPLAVTSSAAAAGVHAAVGPAHVSEGFLIGSFFVFSSLFQLGWAALVTTRPSRRLLVLGVGGNVAFIVLWGVTRTVGLPFGLTPGAEGVGAWDLSAVIWEATVVATCLMQLRVSHDLAYVGSWMRWSAWARTWLVVSVLALGMLTVMGAGA